MKKYIIALFLILLSAAPAQAVTQQPCDLVFTPRAGGKFIYFNNPEAVTNEWLADTSNENPKYLMNNEDLGPDYYSLYISVINHTGPREMYTLLDKGFDIEVDVQITAKEDATFVVHKTAFETPQLHNYLDDGVLTAEEDSYAHLNACARMLGEDIYQLKSAIVYEAGEPQEPVTVELKKGETVWLSSFVENYSPVVFRRTMFLAGEVEVQTGVVDMNIAALRSTGTVGDRSHMAAEPAFGEYVRDRMFKGVADNLPIVDTWLEYEVDQYNSEGTYLPVKIYNQYNPDGYQMTEWVTHLNPQADGSYGKYAAESDLMVFKYKDASKLLYYGPNIPEEERDDVWVFDAYHSDTIGYDGLVTGLEEADYLPNYPLSTERDNTGFSCSVGNFGVATTYHISINNNSYMTRYWKYNMRSASNAIVIVRDGEGNLLQPVVSKGATDDMVSDMMACVELLPMQVTEVELTVILPVNQFGGIRNSMYISDTPRELEFAAEEREQIPRKLVGGDVAVRLKDAPPQTQTFFAGNENNYEFIETGDGYMARWRMWDGLPGYYSPYRELAGAVVFLDKELNIQSQYLFPALTLEASYARGRYYVRTADGAAYWSADGAQWQPYEGKQLPRDNGGAFAAVVADGAEYLTPDGETFLPVEYQGAAPGYIEALGGVYYYTEGDTLYTSRDGVYWSPYTVGGPVETVQYVDGYLVINGREALELPQGEGSVLVFAGGTALGFDSLPVVENGRTLVPMRLIFEQLGMQVEWDQETQTAAAAGGGQSCSFTVDSAAAQVNGQEYALDVPARLIDGRVLVPVRVLAEGLGYNVDWDGENRTVSIQK